MTDNENGQMMKPVAAPGGRATGGAGLGSVGARPAGPFCYKYPHPALTADCVIFGYDAAAASLSLLLIERKSAPCAGCWAFPGGFMEIGESIEECARRELCEETTLNVPDGLLEQVGCYSAVGRDPRERVVTVAFEGLVARRGVRGGDDAGRARWFALDEPLPPLAFDHAAILHDALRHVRLRLRLEPVGLGLLPEPFSQQGLERLYAAVLGRPLRSGALLRQLLSAGVLRPGGAGSGGELRYAFCRGRYEALRREGFWLDL